MKEEQNSKEESAVKQCARGISGAAEFQQFMEIKNQLWERLNEFMKLRS